MKCTACGAFYNGSIYNKCPYCSGTSSKENEAPKQEKKEPNGVLGLLGKKKSTTPDHPVDVPVQDEPAPAPEPVREPPAEEKPVAPRVGPTLPRNATPPETPGDMPSLPTVIGRAGRTVGKYISNNAGESIAPVVGWIVGIKGACHGQSFQLKSGRNKIGRSHDMDVKLMNDESVSRASVAVIVFDTKACEFSILPGESDSLCYVDDKAVYDRRILSGYERIEFGDAGLNRYIFVPFCGPHFQWAGNADV